MNFLVEACVREDVLEFMYSKGLVYCAEAQSIFL